MGNFYLDVETTGLDRGRDAGARDTASPRDTKKIFIFSRETPLARECGGRVY